MWLKLRKIINILILFLIIHFWYPILFSEAKGIKVERFMKIYVKWLSCVCACWIYVYRKTRNFSYQFLRVWQTEQGVCFIGTMLRLFFGRQRAFNNIWSQLKVQETSWLAHRGRHILELWSVLWPPRRAQMLSATLLWKVGHGWIHSIQYQSQYAA